MSNTIEFATKTKINQMTADEKSLELNGLTLVEYFNSITLPNQLIQNYTTRDDGVDIVALQWIDGSYFSTTPEGLVGITVPSWEKRNSGFEFDRMYHPSNIEPDIFAVFRRVGNNYSDFTYIKYNNNRLVCVQSVSRDIGCVIYIDVSFDDQTQTINIDKFYVETSSTSQSQAFNVGIKKNNRELVPWSPYTTGNSIKPFEDGGIYNFLSNDGFTEDQIISSSVTNIIDYDLIDYDKEFKLVGHTSTDSGEHYDTKFNTNVGHFDTINTIFDSDKSYRFINHKSSLAVYHNNYNLVDQMEGLFYNFFIEGVYDSPTSLNVTIDNQVTFNMKSDTNDFILSRLNLNNLKIVAKGAYNKLVSPGRDLNMIKGYIKGDINTSNCSTAGPSSFIARCFRESDNLLIGEYPVVNGSYDIPNLNVNDRYTIILVDRNRVFKQQVNSYRKPTPYIQESIPTNISLLNVKSKLVWYTDGGRYWDTVEVFERTPDGEYDTFKPIDTLTTAMYCDNPQLTPGNFYKIKISGNGQSIKSNEVLFLKDRVIELIDYVRSDESKSFNISSKATHGDFMVLAVLVRADDVPQLPNWTLLDYSTYERGTATTTMMKLAVYTKYYDEAYDRSNPINITACNPQNSQLYIFRGSSSANPPKIGNYTLGPGDPIIGTSNMRISPITSQHKGYVIAFNSIDETAYNYPYVYTNMGTVLGSTWTNYLVSAFRLVAAGENISNAYYISTNPTAYFNEGMRITRGPSMGTSCFTVCVY